ncbi:MAG TPA: FKBP-type peptidyl-prolyl cis-trans isomerase [Microbacteriaceae bacterium]|nr:FKBP-type peptidyl-prolyl cis-trans isomerase [Microbacteriaceae bacterium]
MKRSIAIIPVALAFALTLTSCQAAEDDSTVFADDCISSGSVSESVTIEGEHGGELIITSSTPISADSVERSVLIEGDGDAVSAEETYMVGVSLFNGRTGEQIAQLKEAMQQNGPYHDVLNDALKCAHVGDRTVVTLPASEMYGVGQVEEMGIPGLLETDSIVLAFDFMDKVEVLEQASGKELTLPEEAPKVEIADNGEPTITFPEGLKAPEKLSVYPMIEGEGQIVEEDDAVTVHYRGVIWRTGEEFDSSWVRGAPADFSVGGVIPGFKEALVGYKVGSRLISVVPANDGGYGPEWLVSNGYEEDDVMVFVLDILNAS